MSQPVAIPPVDVVMPEAQMGLIAIFVALALGSLIYCGLESRRTRSWLPLAIFLGAGLAMFGESLVIQSMHVWYPAVGQVRAYEAFGQSIPVFAALAYWFYFAPAILLLMKKYAAGISYAQFWMFWGLTIAGVVAYEVIGLSFDLWIYYGVQPFTIGKLPMSWAFLNAMAVIPASVVLYRAQTWLRGPAVLLVIPFMAAQVPAFEFLSGYPLYVTINSAAPLWAAQLAALTAIGMTIGLTWVCSKLVCTAPAPRT